VRLAEVSPAFWSDFPSQPVEILFVSALYGLLFWDELIQDYNCHFAERTRNGKERTVSEIWKHTLTSSLSKLIKELCSSGAGGTVYDLLSEEEYQHAFRGGDLEKLGVDALHRVVRNSHGPDVPPDLATLVGRQLPGSSIPEAIKPVTPGRSNSCRHISHGHTGHRIDRAGDFNCCPIEKCDGVFARNHHQGARFLAKRWPSLQSNPRQRIFTQKTDDRARWLLKPARLDTKEITMSHRFFVRIAYEKCPRQFSRQITAF
jgi:Peroxide stress protein YaaA